MEIVDKHNLKFQGRWVDTYRNVQFLTAEGYLTEEAKSIMRKNGLRTLEELLDFVPGYWGR